MGGESSGAASVNQQPDWWVFCLCAAWCGVCREYRDGFHVLQTRFSQVRFAWIDVEDREDLVGDLDVETFPTLLIGSSNKAKFLGPLLPQHKVLERLLTSFLEGAPADGAVNDAISLLFARVVEDQQHRQNTI